MPVASGAIHVWHIPALVEILGDNSCFQFGGILGYSWGNAPSVIANRVALEASIQARNESWSLSSGEAENQVIHKACKWSPQLATACEFSTKVKFEFEVMDTL